MGIDMADDETADSTIADAGKNEEVTEFIKSVLETCIKDGMQVPLTIAAVGVNGNVLVIRYVWSDSDEDLHGKVISKHYEDRLFEAPINIIVVDSRGETFRALIKGEDIKYLH